MYNYPKPYLSIPELIQKLKTDGMIIDSQSEAEEAFNTIGYYRLRGYFYHQFNKKTKKYEVGTNLSEILKLYHFDSEISHLIFSYISEIEVALRVRFVNAFQPTQEALVLEDPSFFKDKKKYWENKISIAREISRSNDVFIAHNFKNHDGAIPMWATVEIMSFGTLSKLIKNLKTGHKSVFSNFAQHYTYVSTNEKQIIPSQNMISSWIYAVSAMRNICAHNSRIYNRSINIAPRLISSDSMKNQQRYNGLYQIILAMKYLRPTDKSWNDFVEKLIELLQKYKGVYEFERMNFPSDWANHFQV